MADVITFFFPFSVFSKFLQNACIAYRIREKINSISEAKQGHASPPSCGQTLSNLSEGHFGSTGPSPQFSF